MPEEILNPSDFHVGWLAQSLAGDIYVIVKATDKTVTCRCSTGRPRGC